jgi:hypothetical protein
MWGIARRILCSAACRRRSSHRRCNPVRSGDRLAGAAGIRQREITQRGGHPCPGQLHRQIGWAAGLVGDWQPRWPCGHGMLHSFRPATHRSRDATETQRIAGLVPGGSRFPRTQPRHAMAPIRSRLPCRVDAVNGGSLPRMTKCPCFSQEAADHLRLFGSTTAVVLDNTLLYTGRDCCGVRPACRR